MPNREPLWRVLVGGRRAVNRAVGMLIGFLVGAVGPIVVWHLLSALDGYEPGGNSSAGTAFALLSIFTAPLGALVGSRLGHAFGQQPAAKWERRRKKESESEWRRRVMGDNERPADE